MSWREVVGLVLVLAAVWPVVGIVRFVMLPREAKRYWLPARWHRLRWRWLATNLRLAYLDQHRKAARPVKFGTAVQVAPRDMSRPARLRLPKARFYPDPFGWQVAVKLVPGVSRAEVEKAAPYLADSWRCWRVGITQPKPGRLVVRAMRRDPLAESLGPDVLPPFDGRHLVLGRDEFGQLRRVSLVGLSGSVIGGSPGRGKSQCGAALAVQLAPVASSAWYLLDGGGGADWSAWAGRAARFAADDLAEARDVLEDAHARMVKRLATLTADLGTRNAWTVGPTPGYPLLWVVLDESHQYLDLDTAKALGKDVEQQVRAIRGLTGNMLRRGRKCLVHVTLLAQKCTSTSIPPDLRDLAGLRLAFGCPTTENAVAVLGDDIRQFPTLSPTGLQGDEHVGVCTARLKTGSDPYTRLRVPFVDEDQADRVAAETALVAVRAADRQQLVTA